MEPNDSAGEYFIWGIDDSPYGPVTLPVLQAWVKDERVLPDTWVFARHCGEWLKACELGELKDVFQTDGGALSGTGSSVRFKPGALRRIKILAEMKDAQLAHLSDCLEFQEWPQHAEVVRQGEPGDALFLIMKGELRARTMLGGRETILTTFGIGDFFGELSLFDQGPRSADIVANTDSTLLRLTAGAFARLTREMPSLATPFLQATARTLSGRIRADNQRLTRVSQQYSASRDIS